MLAVQSALTWHCRHWPATQTGVDPPQQVLPQAGWPLAHGWQTLPPQMSPDRHCDCAVQLSSDSWNGSGVGAARLIGPGHALAGPVAGGRWRVRVRPRFPSRSSCRKTRSGSYRRPLRRSSHRSCCRRWCRPSGCRAAWLPWRWACRAPASRSDRRPRTNRCRRCCSSTRRASRWCPRRIRRTSCCKSVPARSCMSDTGAYSGFPGVRS